MRVTNIKKDFFDVYIGRPTVFDNPFFIGINGNRDAVCDQYKRYFWDKINEDQSFREQVMMLKGKTLGCFCHPKRCHGETIVAWFEAGMPLR